MPSTWGRATGSVLYKAMAKYGVGTASIHVLEECASEAEMYASEEWWESYLRSIGARLYNVVKCGSKPPSAAGRKISAEHKAKLQAGRRLLPMTEAHFCTLQTARASYWQARRRVIVMRDFSGSETRFDTIKQASFYLDIDPSHLSKVLRGVKKTKRLAGYSFRFEGQ